MLVSTTSWRVEQTALLAVLDERFHRCSAKPTGWAPSQGCTEWAGVAYGPLRMEKIRTCTEAEGCSGWKKVGS